MTEKIKSVTGMNDILPGEAKLWQTLESSARGICEAYGFAEIRTPILEDTPLFSRGIGTETQVVQKEMYTFTDKGGDSVTMRPEGTAGVVRAYIEHALSAQDEITKLYYMGPMFRYERPQKGRLRQFHQIGTELLGVDSPFADAEVVTIVDRLAKAVGIREFDVFVNSLGTLEERRPYLEKLVSYFRASRDALCEDCQNRLEKNPLRLFDCKKERCQDVGAGAPLLIDNLSEESKRHFGTFQEALAKAGVAFKVNPRIVRGLDYYEKTSFEFVSDRLGAQSAFGGGGRYNRLVEELGGKATPGVGFGLGCERMILLMQEFGGTEAKPGDLRGVYFIGFNEIGLAKGRELMQVVRDQGLRAEAAYEPKSMKSQMRRANKLGFRFAAIIGDDELAGGVVALKNLGDGSQEPVPFAELAKKVSS